MIKLTGKGEWEKTRHWMEKLLHGKLWSALDHYGELGVNALANATPVDTGLTQASWGYRVIRDRRHIGLEWFNTNDPISGVSVAILVQYGHGTGTGGWVQGRDFINPAMRPIFDMIANGVWEEVKNG